MLKRTIYGLAALLLLVGAILVLEWMVPSTESPPPIRPELRRVGEREILVDGGMIDRYRFVFDESIDGAIRIQRLIAEANEGAPPSLAGEDGLEHPKSGPEEKERPGETRSGDSRGLPGIVQLRSPL